MKWISVKDRLPEDECLCMNYCGDYMVGYVDLNNGQYDCRTENEFMPKVTHWAKIEPPEED